MLYDDIFRSARRVGVPLTPGLFGLVRTDAYDAQVGAHIVAHSTPAPNDPHLRLVAAWLPDNECTPFVTWFENMNDSKRVGRPVYYEGHYHRTLAEFAQDWDTRCRRWQVEESR